METRETSRQHAITLCSVSEAFANSCMTGKFPHVLCDLSRTCGSLHRFMIGSSDSDSDDDKRVVRSAKDRRFDELKATCEEMRVSCLMYMSCTRASAGNLTFLWPCPDARFCCDGS